MNDVTVYITSTCPYCVMLTNFLKERDIPYKEINVEHEPNAMAKVVASTGQMGVPQTEVNGKWVIGFDPDTIMTALN